MKRRFKLTKRFYLIAIIIAIIILAICINKSNRTTNLITTPELSRTQAYDDVLANEEFVYDNDGNLISQVQFDAFFLKDKDGDGIADAVRGTCNHISSKATLYMEISVIEDGYVKDGIVSINSENFYFETAIVKDSEVAGQYISSNTETIEFNDLNKGLEKFLIGYVWSGNNNSAIGNDTTKYSMENSIVFSGVYVNSEGTETEFSKEVPFIVDWYGEVDVNISPVAQTVSKEDLSTLLTEDGLTLDFTITTEETLNELIMYGSYISGTIPELNGYKATSVKISGSNVTYTYDEETGYFTARKRSYFE